MLAITKKIISYRLPTIIKQGNTITRSNIVDYNEAHEIGVLSTLYNYEKQQVIRAFIEQLQADDKKVKVLCYDTRKEKTKIFGFDCFTKRDISFIGKFSNSDVIDFIGMKFDYLFHVDFESDVIMNKILAMSNAHCRVGRFDEEQTPFYELMINTDNMDDLCEEMYRYTKILKGH